ncbi:MAG: oxidoreductase [Martelella sp.]|uniref:SDR family NAD(P)-dependent oxidoreductase n=1 Tax=unclassified Martelella TaxID=2629616 RepID=UPI000C5DFFBF|nr:glucose 1-dehydrogenase [Martelella sp.]MAU21157.1 oxidoreductase [Martelella sp.]
MRLEGKVALVTGASRGIGLGVVERFSEEGAIVYAGSTSNPSGVYPEGVIGLKLDVANEDDWANAIERIIAEQGRIDCLVNNAGIAVYDGVADGSTENWRKVLGVNQDGVFFGMRAVIPHMQSKKSGSIINVSSIWGKGAVPGAHAYHASKGAVIMMTKNAAITHVGDGIRVNSVHPGFIDTPLTQAQDPEINKFVIGMTPMGRAGTPREIANGCLYLASDEASFVTGAELVIDGGYLAQ